MDSSDSKADEYIKSMIGFVSTLFSWLLISGIVLGLERIPRDSVCTVIRHGEEQTYEIRMDLRTDRKRGSQIFSEGLSQAIKTYRGDCTFIRSSAGYSDIIKNNRSRRFFFILNGKNLCSILRSFSGKGRKKARNTIFGPRPVPSSWGLFPQKNCMEKNFSYTLSLMGSYAVHSSRVEKWLATRSGLSDYPKYKFAKIRACTMMHPTYIKPWKDRMIDVILFEKYADYDHSKQGQALYKELKKAGLKVARFGVNGGNQTKGYTHRHMEEVANNAKFVIYFSFWDTGAIALLEIQSFGVYSFTSQSDLIDKEGRAGMYVESLKGDNMTESVKIILQRMKRINEGDPDSSVFASVNQERNHCHRSLEDICAHVRQMPTWKDP